MGAAIKDWGKRARSAVKGVRFVAGLGVAHFPYDLTAERVQHVKRLAASKISKLQAASVVAIPGQECRGQRIVVKFALATHVRRFGQKVDIL